MAMSKKAPSEFPPTQVEPRAKRRVFSIEFKRSIVEKAAACSEPGEVGKLLRTHGLYSSHLTDWKRQHAAGDLKGYGRLRRGPIPADKPLPAASCQLQQRIEHLERENQRLRLRAVKAEALVEFQKKGLAAGFRGSVGDKQCSDEGFAHTPRGAHGAPLKGVWTKVADSSAKRSAFCCRGA